MILKIISFNEPIYTRRTAFNHEYDITLNDITKGSNNSAFSDEGYTLTLLNRLSTYSRHEKMLFLHYQLTRSKTPLRWLLDFERLVELNNWKSEFEFINCRTEDLNTLKEVISTLFKDVENGKYTFPGNSIKEEQVNNETLFNTKDACAYLNISKSTIYKLTSNKSIAFYKPNGKNMYFKKEALDNYIKRHKQISNSDIETQTNNYLTKGWKL
jgi:excisionase family DNA binding protein